VFAAAAADAKPVTAAKPVQPCSLVSVRQMQTITKLRVAKRVLAPLGPTCIYSFTKTKAEITLTIETRNFSSVASQMTARKRVSVQRREGYCGKVGLPTLYVSLPHRRVLAIAAGCTVAQKIAAVALVRLKL